MNSFVFLLLCTQACLIQVVYSQCGYDIAPAANVAAAAARGAGFAPGWAGPAAYGPAPYGPAPYGPVPYGPTPYGPAPYGSSPYNSHGSGNVAVAGELGVAGSTLVAGQVPVLGAVKFNGQVPASGVVTIIGSCGCGCEYLR